MSQTTDNPYSRDNNLYLRFEAQISKLLDKKFPGLKQDILQDLGNFVHFTRYKAVFDELNQRIRRQSDTISELTNKITELNNQLMEKDREIIRIQQATNNQQETLSRIEHHLSRTQSDSQSASVTTQQDSTSHIPPPSIFAMSSRTSPTNFVTVSEVEQSPTSIPDLTQPQVNYPSPLVAPLTMANVSQLPAQALYPVPAPRVVHQTQQPQVIHQPQLAPNQCSVAPQCSTSVETALKEIRMFGGSTKDTTPIQTALFLYSFIDDIENFISTYNIRPEQQSNYLLRRLTGEALQHAKLHLHGLPLSNVIQKLKLRYVNQYSAAKLKTELTATNIHPNETILQFGNRISQLGQLISRLSSTAGNQIDVRADMVETLKKALKPNIMIHPEVREAIHNGEFDEIVAQVYQACVDDPEYKIGKTKNFVMSAQTKNQERKREQCVYCHGFSHDAVDCRHAPHNKNQQPPLLPPPQNSYRAPQNSQNQRFFRGDERR